MSSDSTSHERREYPRRDIIATAQVYRNDQERPYPGKIFNISPKGLYIETDASLEVGEFFWVKVVQSMELRQGDTYRCLVIRQGSAQDYNSGLYAYGAQFL